jgi:hypothetical protein
MSWLQYAYPTLAAVAVNHGWKASESQDRNGVAGEADLVAVISQAAPAVEEQRPLPFPLLVSEVRVVEPPGGIHAGTTGVGLLLPVKPPEVNTLLFQRMVQNIEVVSRELLIRNVERYVLLGGRIHSHGTRHGRVRILERLHTRRQMQIERNLQALIMDVSEELLRFGK